MERLPGRYVVGLACEGRVRVMAAVMQGPADELRERHGLAGVAARLGAEGLVAATLLSAHIKGEERMTVEVRSEWPAFSFLADIDAVGKVRARFSPTRTEMSLSYRGVLAATKSLGQQVLYRGVSEVQQERFEAALLRFLTTSQQVDARVRIESEVAADGMITFASGLLVERLPDMGAEEFAARFDGPLKSDFKTLMHHFAFGELAGSRVEVLGAQDFRYQCTCSAERVRSMLRSLGKPELESLLAEHGKAEITCHFCNERYEVPGPELRAMIDGILEN